MSTFRGKSETNRGNLTTKQLFSQFSRIRAHNDIILKMWSYSASRIMHSDKRNCHGFYYRKAAVVHFSTPRTVIFHIFIYVLHDNIASVLLLRNLGNVKSFTIETLVLVLQNLLLIESFFPGRFIQENSNNLINSLLWSWEPQISSNKSCFEGKGCRIEGSPIFSTSAFTKCHSLPTFNHFHEI